MFNLFIVIHVRYFYVYQLIASCLGLFESPPIDINPAPISPLQIDSGAPFRRRGFVSPSRRCGKRNGKSWSPIIA